jgi:hypothetical protein
MGAPINTSGDEDAPYLHPDGKTIYISSNGHASMGGYDIFYSQMDAEGEWKTPINVGYPINTTDDDHSYISTPDGSRAYYSSKGSNSIGSTDIYVVEYGVEENEAIPEIDMSVFALLKGWVFPAPNQALPTDLEITITNIKTGDIKGQAKPVERNGSFVFIIPSGETYDVDFTLSNGSIYKERISIPDGQAYQELSREIFLAPPGSSKPAIALKDEVLGNVLKWRLSFKDPEKLVPLGSMIYYMDEDQNIVDSVYISKDGFFEFKKLSNDQHYVLKPVLAKDLSGDLKLEAIGETTNEISMVPADRIFYEEGRAPSEDVADVPVESVPEKIEEPVNEIVKFVIPEAPEEPTEAEPKTPTKTTAEAVKPVRKPVQNNDPIENSNTVKPLSDQKEFRINYEFNVASQIPESEIKTIAQAIEREYKKNGSVNLTLIGSASYLSTNRNGGNIELAELRLKYGKSALSKELRNLGLDINKISTIKEETRLNGPKPEEVMEHTEGLFIDHQYFMVILN